VTPRLAIGIGCRKGCAADAIAALVRQALALIPPLLAGEGGPSGAEGRVGCDAGEVPHPAARQGPRGHPPPLRGWRDWPEPTKQPLADVSLFTAESKGHERGLLEAAAVLGMRLILVPHSELQAAAPRCETHSERVQVLLGLPSLAECAALAGAGPGSRLILKRISEGGASCAVALPAEARP
jgi:cobalt-precorrin 5A hydrolase